MERPGHPKRTQIAQNVNILHKYFAHRFPRASWPAVWPKPPQNRVRNSVWTAPARVDRMLTVFLKTHPGTTFWKDFGVILGAESRYFGNFWADDGTFFRRWVRSRCQGYGTVFPHPKLISSQRSKSIYPARHMIRSSLSLSIYLSIYPSI